MTFSIETYDRSNKQQEWFLCCTRTDKQRVRSQMGKKDSNEDLDLTRYPSDLRIDLWTLMR